MDGLFRFFSSLLRRLRGETGLALARTFAAKGVAALGALGLVFIIGRQYGPEGVGAYALAQGVLLGAGILSRRGMDNALMRYVGQDRDSPLVKGYLYWAIWRSFWVSVPLSVLVVVCRDFIQQLFDVTGLADMLLGVGVAIPFYSALFLLSGFFKGIRKPATAGLLENGSISLVTGFFLLVAWHVWPTLGYGSVGWAYAFAACVIALQGWCQSFFWLRRRAAGALERRPSLSDFSVFQVSSNSFFAIALATLMQSVLSIMIAGLFLGSVELGLFKASQQVALSIGFVLMVINAIFPPKFAALYHRGELDQLGRLARTGSILGIAMAGPFLLVCLLIPEWILGFFGEGFSHGATLLRVMALGQMVNVATGSVGYLLNMTGHERLMRNIALLCSSLSLLGFLFLTPVYGALGAAVALSIVMVMQNLMAMFFVWRVLSIWILPTPNVLKFLGVKPGVG